MGHHLVRAVASLGLIRRCVLGRYLRRGELALVAKLGLKNLELWAELALGLCAGAASGAASVRASTILSMQPRAQARGAAAAARALPTKLKSFLRLSLSRTYFESELERKAVQKGGTACSPIRR